MSSETPNTPSSPSCRTRARTLSCRPARACFCRSLIASKQSLTTMEKSSPLTSKSQLRWGRYPILPNHITRGNAASTNTPTASSDSTSQKVQTSLFCPIPMSKGSRINLTHAQKDTRLPDPSRGFLQRQKSARCTSLLNGPLINDKTELKNNHVGDHRIVDRIGVFGDVEIFLDDTRRVGEARPVAPTPLRYSLV